MTDTVPNIKPIRFNRSKRAMSLAAVPNPRRIYHVLHVVT